MLTFSAFEEKLCEEKKYQKIFSFWKQLKVLTWNFQTKRTYQVSCIIFFVVSEPDIIVINPQ